MTKIAAKKICVIRLSALGDVVHGSAFINGLRKGYPDAHITWVLQPLTYDLVKNQKNVDRFIIFDRKGGKSSWDKLAEELKDEQFDLTLMLQVSLKASMISRLIKGGVKLGFDYRRSREAQWLFSNCRIPHKNPAHVLDQFYEFLDYLEIENYPVEWDFHFSEEELAFKSSFFEKIPRPVVGFVMASSNVEKDWGIENYAEVVNYVETSLNMQPMLIGGPSGKEKDMAAQISALCKEKPVIALEKPIRNTLLQLAGSKIVIAPDTGPMHMAVALNVPTIALYGYSDPRRCGPYGRFHDLLIDKYNLPGETKEKITRKTKKGRIDMINPADVIEKLELAKKTYLEK
ncbi:MAG: glycosyltransferase family 9 protein [Desulfobacterales bacterium]|nr:glycosyltransferase family 9 protein [Desulfobacterales bacterium]